MIAKLAYLTSPAPGVYILNLQLEGGEGVAKFEISEAHLANIIVDGASFALRKSRVQSTTEHSALGVRSPFYGEG